MLQFNSEFPIAAAEEVPLRSCATDQKRGDEDVNKGVLGNEKKGRTQQIHMETAKKFIEGREKRYLKD